MIGAPDADVIFVPLRIKVAVPLLAPDSSIIMGWSVSAGCTEVTLYCVAIGDVPIRGSKTLALANFAPRLTVTVIGLTVISVWLLAFQSLASFHTTRS